MKSKILFIITKSSIGGAQKFVCEQVQICAESGLFDCYLATNSRGWINDNIEDYISDGFYDTGIENRYNPTYLIRLKKFIKKNNIELVVCNSANGGLYGRLAARLTGIHSIYVSHGWSSVYNGGWLSPFLNAIEYILGRLGSKVLCISNTDFDIAKNRIKIPASKLIHLNNAIFPVEISDKTNRHGEKTVFSLARFTKPKRNDLIVLATAKDHSLSAHLFGNGELLKDVEDIIIKNNIENVRLEGEVSNFKDYKAFSVFILISESEGLPISAIEAMSAGRPLVLSNVGGCPSLIDGNGALVENNPDSIYTGIQECLKNFDSYSIKSLSLFDQKFNLQKRKSEFLRLYSGLVKVK